MTILPLPSISAVAKMTGPVMQLEPFAVIRTFMKTTPLRLTDIHTYIPALTHYSFIQPFFNIVLTIPFGFYLRYLFQKKWPAALGWSFLLTLSFECLQRSALFGIYPRPYRLFDVDDLWLNTLGAMIGFGITVAIERFLPNRSDIQAKLAERTVDIPLLRRGTAIFIDVCLMVFASFFVNYLALALLLVVVLPEFVWGKTIGMRVVKIRLADKSGANASKRRIITRNIFGYVLVTSYIYLLNETSRLTAVVSQSDLMFVTFFLFTLYTLGIILFASVVFTSLSKKRVLWFESISSTRLVTTFTRSEK
jgi:glycopeptide antibiotics resistance protein/ribosomal protein S28E/S33